jgi:hypothetical protein
METHEVIYVYQYTDQEIAEAAGVSLSVLENAKVFGDIDPTDLKSVASWVVKQWAARNIDSLRMGRA